MGRNLKISNCYFCTNINHLKTNIKKRGKTMILYRPVGTEELDLIADSDYKKFPPRLPEQPIFYPVLNREYAREIAEKWNTQTADNKGYVTEFEVDDEYIKNFAVHTVGAKHHKELWIPAEELENFNCHIIGKIIVTEIFSG